jgi:site-specific recombinase XerD
METTVSNWPTECGPKVRYVTWYRDKATFQRRKGSPRVVMMSDPRSDRPAFEREYHNLMAQSANGTLVGRGASRDKTKHMDRYNETVGQLATLWRASPAFAVLGTGTANQYGRYLDRALHTVVPSSNHTFAEMPVAGMLQKHAIELRSALPKPNRLRLKTDAAFRDHHMTILRNMFHWGLTKGSVPWLQSNPFARLVTLHGKPVLNYSWSPKDWQQFLDHYPLGTQQHLAMLLLRYLGVRVSDLHLLGANNGNKSRMVEDTDPTNKTGLRIEWVEWKNSESRARPIIKRRSLKVHPDLLKALKATPGALDRPTFLVSRLGKHYSIESIGDMFNRWCADAGLKIGTRAHGVRRGGAKRLAENGATLHQIKAWGGWEALANVQRYTGAADNKVMGDGAIDKL